MEQLKKLFFTLFIVIGFQFTINAQDSLIAHYPLVYEGNDITENNPDMILENAPFQNGGVYSNGIYYGSDTTGSLVQTPSINNFNFDDFTITMDFKIDSYPTGNNPIIIGGMLWRWIGAYMDGDKLAFMANDGSDYYITDEVVALSQWHIISLRYSKQYKQIGMYLNGNLVVLEEIPILLHNNDAIFSNEHGGSGDTFKGYWRNLEIFNTSQIAAINESAQLSGIEVFVDRESLNILMPQNKKDISMQMFNISGIRLGTYYLTAGSNSINISGIKSGSHILVFTDNAGNRAVRRILIID